MKGLQQLKLIAFTFILCFVMQPIPLFAAVQTVGYKPLEVHFLDVGQADSILVKTDKATMLIDGGNNEDGKKVIAYLKKQGISKLDYVIATHPHEDHIGGLDSVIRDFDIGKIYMPNVQSDTVTFEDLLDSIAAKGLKISAPVPGTEIIFGTAKITIVAPAKKYEDTNNNSIVLKLTHGENSFLFTGDAEQESEKDMLSKKYDITASILKVGHHGSYNATSEAFLRMVNPKYAVISVGDGNSYGHPDNSVIARLNDAKVTIYRTDIDGTIVLASDGKLLAIDQEKGAAIAMPTPSAVPISKSYIGNKNTMKFHLPTCRSLPAPKNRVQLKSRAEALNKGYDPCKICNQ